MRNHHYSHVSFRVYMYLLYNLLYINCIICYLVTLQCNIFLCWKYITVKKLQTVS